MEKIWTGNWRDIVKMDAKPLLKLSVKRKINLWEIYLLTERISYFLKGKITRSSKGYIQIQLELKENVDREKR